MLYGLTTFLAAALTFLLEPLVAKMLLPLFGGTPSVWNTCVVFFQTMLLAGYGYAHWMSSGPRWRRRVPWHLGVMALPWAFLPMGLGPGAVPVQGVPPVLWQIGLLAGVAGVPFLVVSATTPLIQRWVAGAGRRDPYPLYAASNLGSLLALLGYPVVVEPMWDASRSSLGWAVGYGVLWSLIAWCAIRTLRETGGTDPGESAATFVSTAALHAAAKVPLKPGTRWLWLGLSAVPSSLMLSVTTHLSTNVASVPLLWVLPLALYLVTYILAFARRRRFRSETLERVMPVTVLLLAVVLMAEGVEPPVWLQFPLHLGGLVVISLACHGRLADLRPSVGDLTQYYLWMALGGLAGGVFNALVAPAVFNGVVEYPLVLVLACLLRRPVFGEDAVAKEGWRERLRRDVAPALGMGIAVVVLTAWTRWMGWGMGAGTLALTLGVPVVGTYLMLERPLRFGLGVGAVFLASHGGWGAGTDEVFVSRTYYGLHRVRREGDWVRLYHGPTLHGIQRRSVEGGAEPLAYYHRNGPAGSLFDTLGKVGRRPGRVGVVGAGVGALAAYGGKGQQWTFFELDPVVAFLAQDSGWFTFWRDSEAELRMVLGDARLSLSREEGEAYDLLILDAFSSDAVPAHLLTREALEVYRRRLAPGGLLVIHISNRFLDLETVLEALARDAGLFGRAREDLVLSDLDREAGKSASHWVMLAERESDLAGWGASSGWRPMRRREGMAPWTDRYSNLVGVFRWLN